MRERGQMGKENGKGAQRSFMTLFVSVFSSQIGNNCLTQCGGAESDQVGCSKRGKRRVR